LQQARVSLPLKTSYAPMEARSVDEIPTGREWQYEPKWDGFRCVAFRDGVHVDLQSKAGKPLGRYFPEIVAALSSLKAKKFVLDGELAIPVAGKLDFDQLLQRIHPAASRVKKLSAEFPAVFIVFDLLVDAQGKSFADQPLTARRKVLDAFANEQFAGSERLRLSPATLDLAEARRWFRAGRGSLDGIIAKRIDVPYASGERTAMIKFKRVRTADCVVGGFRYAAKKKIVGSLLLGLYDDAGRLNHVGFTSNQSEEERTKLTPKLEKMVRAPGFTGNAPGGPSRWSTERTGEWEPLAPKLVVEVEYDHFTGGRFRHGTTFQRWRPDKSAKQCTYDQLETEGVSALRLLEPQEQRRPRTRKTAPASDE
jgi:ATP-dependent DNA ligase